MTQINLDIYENDVEISSYTQNGTELHLRFSEPIDATVLLDDRAFPVSKGKCFVNLCSVKDGEISLKLNLGHRKLHLPTLIKDGNSVHPLPFDDDFIRRLSKEVRTLEGQISLLEEKVAGLTESVYGTRLFN